MAWPGPNATFTDAGELAAARAAWAAVARAVRRFEPVTMVHGPGQGDSARELLGPDVDLVERELDDAWMRDIGPTFVTDGRGGLAAVDWVFNGWGAQDWARWEHDAKIARHVADLAAVPVLGSPLVNEGGAIHVDGEGTVLLTDTVQLGPGRNPGWSREQAEAEIHAKLGTSKAIWLPHGLTGDYGRYERQGHVDIVAAFARPGTVVVHSQRDPRHPDHDRSRQYLEILRGQTDAKGRRLEVVEVPAPTVLKDQDLPEGRLREMTRISHAIAEVVNLTPSTHQPYVGVSAFAHKAGLHASAIKVDPDLYEHIDPELVGNTMRMLVSDMAGRASIELKGKELGVDLGGDRALRRPGRRAGQGARAGGLHVRGSRRQLRAAAARGGRGPAAQVLRVESWRAIAEDRPDGTHANEATVKLWAKGERIVATAEGNGPVNALDRSMRVALERIYPELAKFDLVDYKVRILEGRARHRVHDPGPRHHLGRQRGSGPRSASRRTSSPPPGRPWRTPTRTGCCGPGSTRRSSRIVRSARFSLVRVRRNEDRAIFVCSALGGLVAAPAAGRRAAGARRRACPKTARP
ncbi:Agmatine deiminase [Streptomyces tanashiensis]